MGGAAAFGCRFDDAVDCGIGRLVIGEAVDQVNKRIRLEEHESTGIEVVGKRAKRLRTKPDLGAALPASRWVKGCSGQEVPDLGDV